jgi:hypothetical protein
MYQFGSGSPIITCLFGILHLNSCMHANGHHSQNTLLRPDATNDARTTQHQGIYEHVWYTDQVSDSLGARSDQRTAYRAPYAWCRDRWIWSESSTLSFGSEQGILTEFVALFLNYGFIWASAENWFLIANDGFSNELGYRGAYIKPPET